LKLCPGIRCRRLLEDLSALKAASRRLQRFPGLIVVALGRRDGRMTKKVTDLSQGHAALNEA
jgi:hypothetical protein